MHTEIPLGVRLRPRRNVLGDISNRTLNTSTTAPVIETKPQIKPKRSRVSKNEDELPANSKKRQVTKGTQLCSAPAAPSAPAPAEFLTPVDLDSEEEDLTIHIIQRSLPLRANGSEPGQCLDIIDKMYNVYYELEDEFSPKPYMSWQVDINSKMRMILVDWIIEIHLKFKLQMQTLWLTVNILDRYLEKEQVPRAMLQLIGISSLLIANKHEEIYPPEVKEYITVTDNAYTLRQMLEMESAILIRLNFRVSIPTGYHFFCRYLNCIKASDRTRHLASYYAERNLQESDMLGVRPHKFAAAAIYAALRQQNDDIFDLATSTVWTTALQEESGCSEQDLEACARNIVKHVSEDPHTASRRKLVAAKWKYSHERYSEVSQLSLPYI